MALPILRVENKPTVPTLLRYFHQTQRAWSAHLSEPRDTDFGTVYVNSSLDRVWEANIIHDAQLLPGVTPDECVRRIEDLYRAENAHCCAWTLNPSSPPELTGPLLSHFADGGFKPWRMEVMHLHLAASMPENLRNDLTVIPARASYRHMQMLAAEMARQWNEPQLIDAVMLHLDDPHWDCLLAMKDGKPIGTAGVLAVGEIGLIENVFVVESSRGQGVGRLLMSRVMEICARSLFRHVLLSVGEENTAAMKLYREFGFERIGEYVMHIHAQSFSPPAMKA